MAEENNNILKGISNFLFKQNQNDSENEHSIIIPFSNVFRQIDSDLTKVYTLENFYQDILKIFAKPMYIYYGKENPADQKNINIWFDTNIVDMNETSNEGSTNTDGNSNEGSTNTNGNSNEESGSEGQ